MDSYPTDVRITQVLLGRTNQIYGSYGRVVDPCAGDGAMAREVVRRSITVRTNDLYVSGHDFMLDATTQEFWDRVGEFDWVVTNPPYTSSILMPILERSLEYANRGVMALLRLSFLEPTGKRYPRAGFLKRYETNLRFLMPIGSPRPSFTKDGKTDSVTVAWFVWDKKFEWFDPPIKTITNWRIEVI